jgi:hypothetical protein
MNALPIWLTWWAASCNAQEFPLLVGTIAFRCSGDEFLLDLGTGKVEEVSYGAQAWISADSEDLARIAEGSSNAQSLAVQGKVSFGGDIEVLHQFALLVERGKKAASIVAH